jgi:hypothetical protein
MMGSTWTTSPGSLNTARNSLGNAGTQTAALAFGGKNGPGASNTGATEEYDGASWTTGPTLSNTKKGIIRLRTSNCCFSIWWRYRRCNTWC